MTNLPLALGFCFTFSCGFALAAVNEPEWGAFALFLSCLIGLALISDKDL